MTDETLEKLDLRNLLENEKAFLEEFNFLFLCGLDVGFQKGKRRGRAEEKEVETKKSGEEKIHEIFVFR